MTDSTGNYTYTLLDDGTAEITGYADREVTELSIPMQLDGHTVTAIGSLSFIACHALTRITIPDSVTYIGANAFGSCGALTDIHVSIDNPAFATFKGVLFEKATKTLILCPPCLQAVGYAIPEGIKAIGDFAFEHCDTLASISIPASVTAIGKNAFSCCAALAAINLPSSVTVIEENAFNYCEALTSINIPDDVTVIRRGTFGHCCALTSINIPNRVTTIGDNAFAGCLALANIDIPNTVTTIGEDAFSRCPNLTVTVHNSYAEFYCKDNGLTYAYAE